MTCSLRVISVGVNSAQLLFGTFWLDSPWSSLSVPVHFSPCIPHSLHHCKCLKRDPVLLCCHFWEMGEIRVTDQTGYQKSESEAVEGARIEARKAVRKIDLKQYRQILYCRKFCNICQLCLVRCCQLSLTEVKSGVG